MTQPPPSPPQGTPPTAPPSGWNPQPTPAGPAGTGWVQPAAAVRGPVTGLAKIAGIVILLNGIVWTLFWGAATVLGVAAKGYLDNLGGSGVGDAIGGAIATVGVFFLVVAILELLVGVGVLMSKEWGRIGGVVYSLIFGAVTLLIGLSAFGARSDSVDTSGAMTGGIIFLVLAIGYIYSLIVLAMRWRSRIA